MNLQVLQDLSIPEALGDIEIGNSIRFGDVLDSSVPSSGDLQVLLETRDGTGSTGLILLVAGCSPGDEVRFQNLWSEIVISIFTIWVVSAPLEVASISSYSVGHRRVELPYSTLPVLQ